MYQKIMVPLDGSKLAECVFPHLSALAGGCRVNDIVFVRVVEPFYQPSTPEYVLSPEEIERVNSEMRAAAKDYLGRVMKSVKFDGLNVRSEILTGAAAEVLAGYATQNAVDLIIIATHGRSGVSRWGWGSVADRILRSACVPVLMVRAPGCVPGIWDPFLDSGNPFMVESRLGTEVEMGKILIIGECASLRTLLAEHLAAEGHIVAVARTPPLIGELGISKWAFPLDSC